MMLNLQTALKFKLLDIRQAPVVFSFVNVNSEGQSFRASDVGGPRGYSVARWKNGKKL